MTQEIVTIKVFKQSRIDLKIVASTCQETQMETIERLLKAERKRLDNKFKKQVLKTLPK